MREIKHKSFTSVGARKGTLKYDEVSAKIIALEEMNNWYETHFENVGIISINPVFYRNGDTEGCVTFNVMYFEEE